MPTSIMIHQVLDIKSEITKYENPLTYVKNIKIKTSQGIFNISLFSVIKENLISNRVD